jgi:hypothetical protein
MLTSTSHTPLPSRRTCAASRPVFKKNWGRCFGGAGVGARPQFYTKRPSQPAGYKFEDAGGDAQVLHLFANITNFTDV